MTNRLYKLDSLEIVGVPDPYSNPPQVNRPPSNGQPYNPRDPFNWQGYRPTSFGSSSYPSGGTTNNTNTNNRPNNNGPNNRDLDPINNPRDRDELLRLMHKNNVSGIQY